jgi:hypothetical protein
MHFYNPSPLSLGYIPRGSYRAALAPTYLDDEPSSAFSFEGGLGYPAFPHTFSPRVDAETRYRRALHELQAAEEEFDAHLALKRARQAAVLREQALRRGRALAIQAEAERIERARALEAKLAEEYELHQHAHQAQVARDRARHQKHALLQAFVDANPRDSFPSERPCSPARQRPTHCPCGPTRRPMLPDNEVARLDDVLKLFSANPGDSFPSRRPCAPTGQRPPCEPTRRPMLPGNEVARLDDLLKLFSGTHPQPHGPPEQFGSLAACKPRSAEPQSSEKQDGGADALNGLFEFLHGLAAHTKEATNGTEAMPKVRLFVLSVDFQV